MSNKIANGETNAIDPTPRRRDFCLSKNLSGGRVLLKAKAR